MEILDLFSLYTEKVQKASVLLEVVFFFKVKLKAEIANYFLVSKPTGIFL